MIVSLIVAAADNNVIGMDNKMPWHIPEDFKYFKKITTEKPCIMGRKTYESIIDHLGKPLPNRTSYVITRNPDYDAKHVFDDLSKAIQQAGHEANEIMIIGGAQIYKQALDDNLVNRVYLTRVHQSPEGDAFFPELDDNKWTEVSRDDRDGFSFLVFERR